MSLCFFITSRRLYTSCVTLLHLSSTISPSLILLSTSLISFLQHSSSIRHPLPCHPPSSSISPAPLPHPPSLYNLLPSPPHLPSNSNRFLSFPYRTSFRPIILPHHLPPSNPFLILPPSLPHSPVSLPHPPPPCTPSPTYLCSAIEAKIESCQNTAHTYFIGIANPHDITFTVVCHHDHTPIYSVLTCHYEMGFRPVQWLDDAYHCGM